MEQNTPELWTGSFSQPFRTVNKLLLPALVPALCGLLLAAATLHADPSIPYQGRVTVSGTNFDGPGQFKFALIDGLKVFVQATASATVSGGMVTAITVTNAGAGYSSAPSVTFSGGSGSGAAATATENDGEITVTLAGGGSGYTAAPTVTISAPPQPLPVTYWSNDSTSVAGGPPTGHVALAVNKGLFSVHLGRSNGMDAIPVSAIHAAAQEGGAYLRVWFSDGLNGFQLLTPDQFIAPSVYLASDIRLNGITTLDGPLQTAGGNARGAAAMDFQLQRNLPTQVASGDRSFIGGGSNNTASGASSFAAGSDASALHASSFVWNNGGNAAFASTGENQFLIRAIGGVGIGTNTPEPGSLLTVSGHTKIIGNLVTDGLTSGSLVTGGITATAIGGTQGAFSGNLLVTGNVVANSFVTTSDRQMKESFAAVDGREILAQVAAMPIQRWNFKQDAATRHIGPMAQDFYAAFRVGPDDRHIATVDADGVALAAIQGLHEIVREKEAEIGAMKKQLALMQQQIEALQKKPASITGNPQP